MKCFAFFKSLLQEKVNLESSITDLQTEIQGLKEDNGQLMEKVQVSALILHIVLSQFPVHDFFSQNNYKYASLDMYLIINVFLLKNN